MENPILKRGLYSMKSVNRGSIGVDTASMVTHDSNKRMTNQNSFLQTGFGHFDSSGGNVNNFLKTKGNHIEQKTGGLNPRIRAISRAAQFTSEEHAKLANNHADFKATKAVASILPSRILMKKALQRGGYPAPENIIELTNSFYNNIVKNSKNGKFFEHVEGNPLLYKLHADANVIASTVAIIPAATSFINDALSNNDPNRDYELIADAQDIVAFIQMKMSGIPTDAIAVESFAINPWFIASLLLGIILIFR